MERIDDLEFNNLKLIQNPDWFCFGIDSILLVDFAKKMKNNSNVIDLGTGTGILPILLSCKTKGTHFTGIEIQEEVANIAKRNVLLNNLQDKIDIFNMDILNLKSKFSKGSFNVVITNPPYKKKNSGLINNNEKKIISRHEITATLKNFIEISAFLLKDLGEFYMVHKAERLADIIENMRINKIEPKLIKTVSPNKQKKPNIILIKGVKNANPFLEFEKNLYIYNDKGSYTEDILKIYNKI